jgi:hypothetical protein
VRNASLLDEDSLAMLKDMANTEDCQLWIERVEKDGATVIIEDGSATEVPIGATQ